MMNWDGFKNHDGTYYVHREHNKPMPDVELGQESYHQFKGRGRRAFALR